MAASTRTFRTSSWSRRTPGPSSTGARRSSEPADSAESRTLAERCISWGNVGPPMIPPTYNANLQIVQSRDYVVVRHEMIHDDRIIPLDGRPHLGPNIRKLAGDSRGHWEGDTLVVDTTNFTDKTNFRGAPRNTRQDIFASDALHVVERFTRVDADRIRYQLTVEDPRRGRDPGRGKYPSGGLRGRYSSTHVMRGITRSATSSLVLASKSGPLRTPRKRIEVSRSALSARRGQSGRLADHVCNVLFVFQTNGIQ